MSRVATEAPAAIHQILFATDFSQSAERAGKYAVALARRFHAELLFGHVFPTPGDERSQEEWELDRKERRASLASRAAALTQSGVLARSSLSSECPVPLAIELLQKRSGADLVVVGTESKGSIDRFLLGSTAEALIRECPVPVLTIGPKVAPLQENALLFPKIVLASDFSRSSAKAEELALSLASALHSRLFICHVSRSPGHAQVDSTFPAEMDFRAKLTQTLPRDSYEWRSIDADEVQAHIADAILGLVKTVHADLIVMGARERTFRLLHLRKGVTQDVLAQAPCPVLTIH